MRKSRDFSFLGKREVERPKMQKPEVGEDRRTVLMSSMA